MNSSIHLVSNLTGPIIPISRPQAWTNGNYITVANSEKDDALMEVVESLDSVSYVMPGDSKKAIILMLGDSSEDHMARCGADWVMKRGCHALKSLPSMRMC